MHNYDIIDIDGEKTTLVLDDIQYKLITDRRHRTFLKRCRKEKILEEIHACGNYRELEALAKKRDLCDTCCFSDVNLYGIKRVLIALVELLYRYPTLRSKLCYIGTIQSFEEFSARLEKGEKELLCAYNLQYICTEENAKKLGKYLHKRIRRLIREWDEHTIAIAMSTRDLFDAILLNRTMYEGYAYLNRMSSSRYDESVGFHSKGGHHPESTIYHEAGHLLDYLCNFRYNEDFLAYYKKFSVDEIKKKVSEYAATNAAEFIAECFAEYFISDSPRHVAKTVGEMLDKAYNDYVHYRSN